MEVECLSSKDNALQHLLRGLHDREGIRNLAGRVLCAEKSDGGLAAAAMLLNYTTAASRDGSAVDDACEGGSESEGRGFVELNNLRSKACKSSAYTTRARCLAVQSFVEEFLMSGVRMRRSQAACNLTMQCDADCIETHPGADEVQDEAKELEQLAQTVVGQALRAPVVELSQRRLFV